MIWKMSRPGELIEALRTGKFQLPPLLIRPKADGEEVAVDWAGSSFRFQAELLAKASPKSFQAALALISAQYAKEAKREARPLLLTTYLSPERLADLESVGVSGIDLCGNGVVIVADELLVMRTGNPNLFPADRRIQNVYQGVSSLVARVFLAKPNFDAVQDVLNEVIVRGGAITLGTVSKALRVLEEDLVIKRNGRASRLLQADELLSRLAAGFVRPPQSAGRKYRWTGPPESMPAHLGALGTMITLTGAASVERYGVLPREGTVQCYCQSLGHVERALSGLIEAAPRFPDLELVETDEQSVSFDRRSDGVIPYASPVQCWLELQAGDKRQQDAAIVVREHILRDLRGAGWSPP